MSPSPLRISAISFVLLWTASEGCATELLNPNCADSGSASGGPALVVRVRDTENQPAALGTTVRLEGPGPDQMTTGRDPEGSVVAAGNRPGTFDVVITRPWWTSPKRQTIRVPTPVAICDGFQTTHLFVTLGLEPGAPAVRQVVPVSDHIGVSSDPPLTRGNWYGRTQMMANLEADSTVSSEIEWFATEPEIADVTLDGVMTATCRKTPVDTWLIARSRADPRVSARVRVTVHETSLFVCP